MAKSKPAEVVTTPLAEDVIEESSELVRIVQSSGLEKSKADYILEHFTGYFKLASEWEKRASTIVVTAPDQFAIMKMAREGRLFLKAKRVEIEKARKEMKEAALREGKAIDGIANVLKGLIQPIEDHLDRQERFLEIKEDEMREERKLIRIQEMQSLQLIPEMYDVKNMPEETYRQLINGTRLAIQQKKDEEARIEAERIAKEKREAEERERMRAENERLQKEAQAKEKQLAKERAEAQAKQKAIEQEALKQRKAAEEREAKLRAEQEAKLKAQKAESDRKQKEIEAKMAKEREASETREKKLRAEREKLEADARAKAEAESREKERIRKMEEAAKQAPDKEKLLVFADSIEKIIPPVTNTPATKKICADASTLLMKTAKYVRDQVKSL